ncbi:2-dehydropantoate 2-reductase [Umbelopsis sp. PMI_123]|nr:2-dehydropantoate 2-reductase [Umbelopsis sp. PMI_123]
MATSLRNLKTLIVGTGAVGCIYGWRMSQTAAVTTVCRSNYDVVRRDGFDIQSKKWGQGIFRPHKVVRNTEETAGDEFDYVIVTMKALPDVIDVNSIIRPAITTGRTTIVLIQNGLGIEQAISNAFPSNPLLSIAAYIGTSQTAAGKIVMMGDEHLVMSQYPTGDEKGEKSAKEFAELLKAGGVTVKQVSDINRVRWQKLIWNASFSAVCVATNLNTSQVLAHPPSSLLVKNAMEDVIRAANSFGYGFNAEAEVTQMFKNTKNIAGAYKPSMLLDAERGQPMEVEVILGNPLRLAQKNGVNVPYLESLYSICSAINANKQGKIVVDSKI